MNWDANCFFPTENKDCSSNFASYEYRNMSAKRGGTIRTHWKADCLLENLFPEDHENVVD